MFDLAFRYTRIITRAQIISVNKLISIRYKASASIFAQQILAREQNHGRGMFVLSLKHGGSQAEH